MSEDYGELKNYKYLVSNQNILIVKIFLLVQYISRVKSVNLVKKLKSIVRNIQSNSFMMYIIIKKS